MTTATDPYPLSYFAVGDDLVLSTGAHATVLAIGRSRIRVDIAGAPSFIIPAAVRCDYGRPS